MSISVEHSLAAGCTPEQVWKVFQDLERWPSWNRAVAQARWVEGAAWREGSRFRLELAAPRELVLEPVIIAATPPQGVTWDGSGSLLSGANRFSFEPQAGGTTLLRIAGEFSGFGAMLWGEQLKSVVGELFAVWLEALKVEAEKVAATPVP